MGYIGKLPEHGRFAKVDQINSGFNGSATTFNLTVDSVAIYPTNPQNLLISIGGVLQQPGTDYTVSAATLTLTSAPAASTDFFGVLLGDVLDIGTPSDGSVTVSKMAVNSIDSDQYVDGSIDTVHIGDNQVTGTKIAMGSDARGDVLVYDGTNYVRLGADNGKFLRSNGTGSNPSWETASGTTINNNADNYLITGSGTANTLEAEAKLTYTGTAMMIGLAASPPTPDHVSVHVWEGSAGSVTSSTDMQLVVENSGNAGIAIMSPNANTTQLAFGTPQDNRQGGLLYDHNANTLQLRASGVTKMTVNGSNGHVGVGVAPSHQLHVEGAGGWLAFLNATTNSAQVSCLYAHTASEHSDTSIAAFHSGSTYKMVFRGDGKVGIGATTPTGQLHILSTAVKPLMLEYDGSGTNAVMVDFKRGDTAVGSITSSTSSTAFNTSSDQRLKENIVDTIMGLDVLNSIKVRDFNFIIEPDVTYQGFIGQELKEVYPSAVTIPDDVEEFLSIDYGKLTPLLVKAIQELNAKVDALKG